MIHNTVFERLVVFFIVIILYILPILYILCVYNVFHILLSLWQTTRYMECVYVRMYVCMCICWLVISLNLHYFKIVVTAVRFSIVPFATGTWPISRAALHKECRLEIH